MFTGVMGYEPNADAAQYFCNQIFPLVRREVKDARLLIVGHASPPTVQRLAEIGNVSVTGSVADVLPYYQQARLSVVPLRGGGGTRLKILEAMALGRPVVSTSIGCEGLAVRDGIHLEIADEPVAFAQRVVRLLLDRRLREQLAGNARRLVEERYEWSVIAEKLLAVYRRLLEPKTQLPGQEPRQLQVGPPSHDPRQDRILAHHPDADAAEERAGWPRS